MKLLNFMLLTLVLMIGCRAEDTDRQADVKNVETTLHSFYESIESFDYQSLRSITSDDYTLIEDGPVWTVDSLVNRMEQLEGEAELSYELSDIETTVEGGTAWMKYQNNGVITRGGHEEHFNWTESAVFRKSEEGWKMTLLHSTRNEPGAGRAVSGQSDSPLVGGWTLAYGTYGVDEENPVEVRPPDGPASLKVFSNNHFAYVMHDKEGDFLGASAGSYVIDGNRYTETTDWSSMPESIGTRTTFNFRVEGDSLYMSGPVEIVNENGEKREEFRKMEEVRVRAGSNE